MLKVRLTKRNIVITLPISALKFAVQAAPCFEHYDEASGKFLEPNIIDAHAFAQDVVSQLESEKEDVTTIVHEMFDKAFSEAVEYGAEGILLPGDDNYVQPKALRP